MRMECSGRGDGNVLIEAERIRTRRGARFLFVTVGSTALSETQLFTGRRRGTRSVSPDWGEDVGDGFTVAVAGTGAVVVAVGASVAVIAGAAECARAFCAWCEHPSLLKRHRPQRSPGMPEQGVLARVQLIQGNGMCRGMPSMDMIQPCCVAPALAYAPTLTERGCSGDDSGWCEELCFGFFAGGADAVSVRVSVSSARVRFRLLSSGAEVDRTAFSLSLCTGTGLVRPTPVTLSHLMTASAGPIVYICG